MVAGASAITTVKRRLTPMDTLKLLSGALAGLVYAVPDSIRKAVLAFAILVLMDTVTGCWIATRKGTFNTYTMRHKLFTKALEFMTILALGCAGYLVSLSYVPLGITVAILIGIEAASNLENLAWLEHNGGAPLGPFRPALKRLSGYFAPDVVEATKKDSDV
jgi:hypothetical protein